MYKFNISEIGFDPILSNLKQTFSLQQEEIEVCDLLIRSIITEKIEYPILKKEYNEDELQSLFEKVISFAIREAYKGEFLMVDEISTYKTEVIAGSQLKTIKEQHVVNINIASQQELEELPEIGNNLAHKIIEERRLNGRYTGLENLSNRITGIGDETIEKLSSVLRIKTIPNSQYFTSDLVKLIEYLKGISNLNVIRILELTLSNIIGRTKINFTDLDLMLDNDEIVFYENSTVGILPDKEYYYWIKNAIEEAKSEICIAMFHIAFPSDEHPSKVLLDELISAHKRGVDIKVILDSDLVSDPYKSSVINKPAKEYLSQNGIKVKFDPSESLLHSKFVLFDNQISVLGSHNWSAGSYFNYSELSFVIESTNFADQLKNRFNLLWQ